MNFLFDNNLSPYLARALDSLSEPDRVRVIPKREKFDPSTADEVWIGQLAEESNWSIVSHDRFAKNSLEKEALRRSGITTFILKSGWASLQHWERSWRLVRWWPRIMDQAELSSGAFYVPVNFSGKGKFEQIVL